MKTTKAASPKVPLPLLISFIGPSYMVTPNFGFARSIELQGLNPVLHMVHEFDGIHWMKMKRLGMAYVNWAVHIVRSK